MEQKARLGQLKGGGIFEYGGNLWIKLGEEDGKVIVLSKEIICDKAFDDNNKNNWETSTLRKYLNEIFLEELLENGAKEGDFLTVVTDLTADDGTKKYGQAEDLISLITCDDYRKYREHIKLIDSWWWTSTPYSSLASSSRYARVVNSSGALYNGDAYIGRGGVRPPCNLSSETLVGIKYGNLKGIIEDAKEWLVDNWGPIQDDIYETALEQLEEDGIEDETDADILAERISEKIKEGIFNVFETYEPSEFEE